MMSEQPNVDAAYEEWLGDRINAPGLHAWRAGYNAALAARDEDRRDLSALLQEFLDQCINDDCSLCERGRAALSTTDRTVRDGR